MRITIRTCENVFINRIAPIMAENAPEGWYPVFGQLAGLEWMVGYRKDGTGQTMPLWVVGDSPREVYSFFQGMIFSAQLSIEPTFDPTEV